MHDGHDHHHHGFGHNARNAAAQWQTPHLPSGTAHEHASPAEPDLDLVEAAFADSYPRAADPASFLRLAGVPFVGEDAGGRRLSLVRVELNQVTDIGVLAPMVGGGHRYDPLPAKLVSRRSALGFVYFDGDGPLRLTLAEAKALANVTPPR